MAGDVSKADLIPDYTKSAEKVYMDVVKFYLQCPERPSPLGSGFVTVGHALEFLAHVVRRREGPEWIQGGNLSGLPPSLLVLLASAYIATSPH